MTLESLIESYQTRLADGISSREIHRVLLKDGRRAVALTYATECRDEIEAYAAAIVLLDSQGLPVPEVLAVAPDMRWLLLSDAGSRNLSALRRTRRRDVACRNLLLALSAVDTAHVAARPLFPHTPNHLREIGLRNARLNERVSDVEATLVEFDARVRALPQWLAHGDFHSGNLVEGESEGLVTMVDLQDLGLRCAGWDISMFACDVTRDRPYLSMRASVDLLEATRRRTHPAEPTDLSECYRDYVLGIQVIRLLTLFTWRAAVGGVVDVELRRSLTRYRAWKSMRRVSNETLGPDRFAEDVARGLAGQSQL